MTHSQNASTEHRPRLTIDLKAVLPQASFVGGCAARISSVSCHSARVEPHGAFAVIPGTSRRGEEFVAEAIGRGASVLLTETPLPSVRIPQCIVRNVRRAYARVCSALEHDPGRSLRTAAVTGTNGKTSASWLLRSILQANDVRCGLLGTIHYDDGRASAEATLTTPDAADIQAWLGRIRNNRGTHAVLEASSHALDQYRLEGVPLDAAVVTNVTQDHFDYHGTLGQYVRVKSQIGRLLAPGGTLFINNDDPGARAVAKLARRSNAVTFGIERSAEIRGRVIEESLHGSRFAVSLGGDEYEFSTPLIGRHQISNALAAIAVADRWQIPVEAIQAGIGRLKHIPGRLQPIDNGRGLSVFVDYAHTPDALTRSIAHLKRLQSGRIIVVFGAGGDRDRSKRPLMGAAACAADLAVVTSDNPRSEDPEQIIGAILGGMRDARTPPHRESDRLRAIRWAVAAASPGDAVLIAGKGHETEQIIGPDRIPFDDAEVVRDCLASLTSPSHSPRSIASPL